MNLQHPVPHDQIWTVAYTVQNIEVFELRTENPINEQYEATLWHDEAPLGTAAVRFMDADLNMLKMCFQDIKNHLDMINREENVEACFEDLFAKTQTLTFYACIKPTYATTEEECSQTSRQHYFSFSRDGTGSYGKATRNVPLRFTWSWKAPAVTAYIKAESVGSLVEGRYLELDSPYKGRRKLIHYKLLDGERR